MVAARAGGGPQDRPPVCAGCSRRWADSRLRSQALTDELVEVVVGAVRPSRRNGHGDSGEMLLAHQKRIATWVGRDKLSIVKVDQLLTRPGVNVRYRTLHRFPVQRCGFRPKDTTVPVMINFQGGVQRWRPWGKGPEFRSRHEGGRVDGSIAPMRWWKSPRGE